jgi:L-ascorbate metabolism protein UlaG (beta-lactamase superfamily)
MEVRRLAWAGLEVKAAGQTAVVDLVEDFSRLHGGNPPTEEIPPSPMAASAVAGLLTHLHSDHADVDALGRVLTPGAVVLRPERSYGSKAEVSNAEHYRTFGPLPSTPARSVPLCHDELPLGDDVVNFPG